jgi:Dolichyl-phosphate-mannose-protein mannosyltransferase
MISDQTKLAFPYSCCYARTLSYGRMMRLNSFRRLPILFLCFAASRLSLLSLNKAEYTDAYILFEWSLYKGDKRHPLYPMLVQAVSHMVDPIIAGRLIAVMSGAVALYFLVKISTRIYGQRASILAGVLFILSPLGLWVQTRVLTESLFVATSIAAVYYFLCIFDQDDLWAFFGLIVFSGLSALTRPEGIFLVLLLIPGAYHLFVRQKWKNIIYSLPGLIVWGFLFLWLYVRSSAPTYQDEMSFSFNQATIQKVLLYCVSYLEVYPYVLSYPVWLLAVYHLLTNIPKNNQIWMATIVMIHVVFWALLSIHWVWSPRFLILPATLILIEAGAMLHRLHSTTSKRLSNLVLACTFTCSFFLTAFSIFYQREVFADFKDAASFIKTHKTNQRVFSDEFFKVKYYLGTPPLRYSRDAEYQLGDIINLHSFHTDLKKELVELNRQYKLSVVYNADALTIPLLGNGPLERFENTFDSSILQQRFRKQRFHSVVIQVIGKKQAGERIRS